MNDATRNSAADDAAAFAGTEASLGSAAVGLLQAWSDLFVSELTLAHDSLHRLAFGLIAAPVIGMGAWLGICTLLIAVAQTYTASWTLAVLFGVGVQVLALGILLRGLRRWTRDLTLPQSRAALSRALANMS